MSTLQNPTNDQQQADNHQQPPSPSPVGWVQHHYRRLKENAETFPYVWASYAVVYIGFGLWTTYRWRKLRRTEDRVRVLQARLHELVEAEESAASKALSDKATTTTSVPEKAAPSTIIKADESAASAMGTEKALPSEDGTIR